MDIHWYPTTPSITLNAKLQNKIKEKLNSLSSISDQIKNAKQQEEAIDLNHNGDYPNNTPVENDPTPSLETSKEQLEALSKEVYANKTVIKSFTEYTKNHEKQYKVKSDLDSLRSENAKLKNENGKLKERLDILSYILADLQGKTKKK